MQQKMSSFDNVKRHNKILGCRIEERRVRGRPHASWPDNIRLLPGIMHQTSKGPWIVGLHTRRQPFHKKDGTSKEL